MSELGFDVLLICSFTQKTEKVGIELANPGFVVQRGYTIAAPESLRASLKGIEKFLLTKIAAVRFDLKFNWSYSER